MQNNTEELITYKWASLWKYEQSPWIRNPKGRNKNIRKKRKDGPSNQWNKMIKISKVVSEIKAKLQDSQAKNRFKWKFNKWYGIKVGNIQDNGNKIHQEGRKTEKNC